MTRKLTLTVLVFAAGWSLTSCEEIFGDELTGSPVVLNAPSDSTVVADTAMLLSWSRVAATAEYQVQVAQPGFDSLARWVKDTVTNADSIKLTALEKGKNYQWRVRAISRNYVTPYSKFRTFTIKK